MFHCIAVNESVRLVMRLCNDFSWSQYMIGMDKEEKQESAQILKISVHGVHA